MFFSQNNPGDTQPGYFLMDNLVFAPVPLPAATWLLLSGLAGIGAMARRRARQALS